MSLFREHEYSLEAGLAYMMEPNVDGGVVNSSQSVMGPKSSFIEILPFDALRMRIGTIDL